MSTEVLLAVLAAGLWVAWRWERGNDEAFRHKITRRVMRKRQQRW